MAIGLLYFICSIVAYVAFMYSIVKVWSNKWSIRLDQLNQLVNGGLIQLDFLRQRSTWLIDLIDFGSSVDNMWHRQEYLQQHSFLATTTTTKKWPMSKRTVRILKTSCSTTGTSSRNTHLYSSTYNTTKG